MLTEPKNKVFYSKSIIVHSKTNTDGNLPNERGGFALMGKNRRIASLETVSQNKRSRIPF